MQVGQCIEQLQELEEKRGVGVFTDATTCVGVARMGGDDQRIAAGSPAEVAAVDFGPPLHSFVICGEMDDFEGAMLRLHAAPPLADA